jgi:glycosyltransferase involved in cell wall biosynthesis
MRLGIIARCDNTGLGNQTRELVKMLNPDKILLIDSYSFNNNKQYPQWYDGYNVIKTTRGMPRTKEILAFLDEVDVVISCETFYHLDFVDIARKRNIKTILQYNYELFGNLVHPEWPLPDVLLSPSNWNIDVVKEKFGSKCKVYHLPPPTDTSLFNTARENNLSKTHKRILHIAGKKAAKDRNGTNTVVEMLKHSSADYELVIATQTPLDFITKDSRLKINKDNVRNREDLYNGYDAMVLPRRYAGLCLPMNEALISGLPVFMTDISPNNQILPHNWLVGSNKIGEFKTKSMVDIYEADATKLGKTIDNYINSNSIDKDKNTAVELGFNNFSVEVLKDKWLNIINE